jgi:glycogen synthase
VKTALSWYADAAQWARLVANGMAADHSWDRQAVEYERAYSALVGARS